MLDRPGFTRLAGTGGGEEIIREVTFADLARLAERAHRAGSVGGSHQARRPGRIPAHRARAAWQALPGWANRELYTPVFSVPTIAGTAGSGDATIAGFLASVVTGPRSARRR